ncbi:MAG: hypothetical protein RSB69_06440 [Odoribacter sp.]
MAFIEEILNHRSLAIVGMEKNTGKTECLNYILSQIKDMDRQFALTSVGIDGEKRDQVCRTPKPEIEVPEGMIFVTSEKHYGEKRLTAEVLDVCEERTALGRLVIARAKSSGKVLLSGPSATVELRKLMEHLEDFGVQTTIVDGALSRLSLASPAVTEAMILATGAALSGNIPQLVRSTRYVYELIGLEQVEEELRGRLEDLARGVWAVSESGEVIDLHLPSVFMLEKSGVDIFKYGRRLYIAGAVSDQLLTFLRAQTEPTELMIRDFTRMFATPASYYAFLRKGGNIRVLQKSQLVAVTINPQSPAGFCLDSDRLKRAMEESLQIPVYDVRKMDHLKVC